MSAITASVRRFLDLPDDQRVLGPYRCRSLLGKGGFAPVFRAAEEHGGQALREVAVKVFGLGAERGGGGADTAGFRARVVDEARALCRVQHPNVVRFFTLYDDAARGLLALVMEYADGVSLDQQLGDLEPGDPRRVPLAIDVGHAIASALAAAHAAGLVHRDVKPPNVLFAQGVYKLIDFGIAAMERPKRARNEPRQIVLDGIPLEAIGTKASFVAQLAGSSQSAEPISGTVGYIDPVCLQTTAPATPASDLYALGATLFECLAGVVPAVSTARARGEAGLDRAVISGDERSVAIAQVVPAVPPGLARLIDALLSPAREARPRSAEVVARELERLRSERAGKRRALPSEEHGPFRGLERFEEEDRDVYFGRAAEVAGVVELVRQRGLVAVVGASGSGKSSLVRAGVMPQAEEGALGGWPGRYHGVLLNPGSDVRAALDSALREWLGAPLHAQPEQAAHQLAARVEEREQGVLLVIDQLEELATLHAEAHAEGLAFVLELLARLGDSPAPGVRAIVTARRDLLDRLLALDPHFARALTRGMQFLAPLSDSAWAEVVDQALDAYGYRFESHALREEVLAELRGRQSAMPLVQFALTRLWRLRDPAARTITRAAFKSIRGIRGALEQHANATLDELGAVPIAVRRAVLLAMTTPQGTRAHVQRAALRERHGATAEAVLEAFARARLVLHEESGTTIVHESLLSEWALLRGWIEEARADRTLAEEIERDAQRWSERSDPNDLWRKRRLAAALDLEKSGRVALGPEATRFLASGRREERRGRVIAASVVVVAIALVLGGSLAYAGKASRDAAALQSEKDRAERSAARAEQLARTASEKETAAVEAGKLAETSAKTAKAATLRAETAEKDVSDRLKKLTDKLEEALKKGDLAGLKKIAAEAAGLKAPTAAPAVGLGQKVDPEAPF